MNAITMRRRWLIARPWVKDICLALALIVLLGVGIWGLGQIAALFQALGVAGMTGDPVERPRLVDDRGDFKIYNTREYVRVILTSEPPRGVKGCLRLEGFRQRRTGVWEAQHNPANIMKAQAIGTTFFPKAGG